MSNGMFTFGVDPSIDLDIVDITKGTVVVYFADESLFTQVQVIDQATDERYTYDKVESLLQELILSTYQDL
jgi:hypothetical protein